MLDLIIKFLEGTSRFLKKHNSNEKKNGKSGSLLYGFLLFLIIIALLFCFGFLFKVISEIFRDFEYSSYEKGEWKIYFSLIFTLIVTFILVISLFFIGKSKENGVIKFYTLVVPSLFGLIELIEFIEKSRKNDSFFAYILGFFLILFPLLSSLQYLFKILDNSFFNKLKNFFFYYNIGFFFFLSLNVLFATIGIRVGGLNIYSQIINEGFLAGKYINGFFEGLLYSIMFSIVVLLPIYILNLYFETINLNKRKLAISIFIFILVFLSQFISSIFNYFYIHQVNKASVILSSKGDNFKSHSDARGAFLDNAFLNLAKKGQADNYLFEKLYDSTIEEYFQEKISEYTNNRTSFATNLSKVGEKANVILSLGEIENKVKQIDNTFTGGKDKKTGDYYLPITTSGTTSLLETTYKFHFTNETNENQEVVMFFEAPSKNSVVTGLRLGLDLELIGQIAPRGAAKQVYENSLRKNIDPALIEKVGLNTYSLRVFPIPSINDGKTQGKQLVEIKVLSPIEEDLILYSPKISFANLKIEDETSFISKIYNNDDLVKEDIIKNSALEAYLNTNHTVSKSELKITTTDNVMNYCLDIGLKALLFDNSISLNNSKIINKKTKLFFDNSYSVNKNDANKVYDDIYKGFKNYKGKLNDIDIYSYNFEVNKVAEIKDINFRGYTDIDRIVDYIVNNNIENENIVFITDDSNYNKSVEENIGRNLEKVVKNRLSVIKIGKKIKSYKSDFNSLLAASNGNIYELNDISNLENIIDSINSKDIIINNETCKNLNPNDKEIRKIQAGYVSNLILSNIKNSSDWYKLAEVQSKIAYDYNIVNQFNSLIALQTVSQQQELDYYKKQQDKYNADYENHGNSIIKNIGIGNNRRRMIDSYDSLIEAVPASDDFIETTAVAPSSDTPSEEATFDNSTTGYSPSDFYEKPSVNFGSNIVDRGGIVGSNSAIKGGLFDDNIDYDYGFSGSTKISLFSLWILIIYIMEFVWIYAFIKKLFKKEIVITQ